eukprot:Pompholyxophrys_sp_v1_NODE_30_length_3689_cov_21.111998.p2 type:complete len:247 gc:universal NODE_30_length_3689_cov_21.111998:3048-2308(-)
MKQDAALLATSVVPLLLKVGQKIIWKNPCPGSSRFCRPLHLQFSKEDREVSEHMEEFVLSQINNLSQSIFRSLDDKLEIHISHQLMYTMIDGKASNNLTGTGNSTCRLCGAKPSEMNNLTTVFGKPVRNDFLKYGLHTLHLWIRALEYCLNISYSLEGKFASYSRMTKGESESLQKRTIFIQQQLWQHLHLIVDQPKAGGAGTSNNGNTARRFFQRRDQVAQLTGFDSGILDQISVYLRVLCCGYA